ncbi:MAG: hypothetical protein J2P48_07755 [Alphaproteobacteria bacterium]|nr:hypothetical protein [Alphaproteobacteria bacterium]
MRAAHPDMTSQLAIPARVRATEALHSALASQKKAGTTITAAHWECGTVRSDTGGFRLEKGNGIAGFATAAGCHCKAVKAGAKLLA